MKTIEIELDDDYMRKIKRIDTIFMGRPMKLEDDHIRDIILGAIDDSLEFAEKMKRDYEKELYLERKRKANR